MIRDRAALVAKAMVDDLVNRLVDIIRTDFHPHLEQALRDEFEEERRQGVADRGDDDA